VFVLLVCRVTSFAIVGYLPEYRYNAIKDYSTLMSRVTHLLLFSIEVDPNGDLAALDRLPPQNILQEIQHAKKIYHTKVLMCFGGYGRSNGFSQVVRDPKKRAHFILVIIHLCDTNQFDGVDMNWEYPRTSDEWNGLFDLFLELHNTFQLSGRIVTMAMYPGQERVLNDARVLNSISLIHMMTYDQNGPHSTFEFAQRSVEQIKALHIPLSKFTLGLPFYARNIFTGEPETYFDLVKNHGPLLPETDQINNFYFNGYNT